MVIAWMPLALGSLQVLGVIWVTLMTAFVAAMVGWSVDRLTWRLWRWPIGEPLGFVGGAVGGLHLAGLVGAALGAVGLGSLLYLLFRWRRPAGIRLWSWAVLALLWLGGWWFRPSLDGPAASTSHPNVVWVMVHGLRADLWRHPQELMPTVEHLGEQGLTSPLVVTGPDPAAHVREVATALTPLAEEGVPVWWVGSTPLDDVVSGFALQDLRGGWPTGWAYTAGGRRLQELAPRLLPSGFHAQDAVERIERVLRGTQGRFVAVVELTDPLPPFRAPIPFDAMFSATDRWSEEGDYHGEVAHVDEQIQRLMAAVAARADRRETLWVVSGVSSVPVPGTSPLDGRVSFLVVRWPGHVVPRSVHTMAQPLQTWQDAVVGALGRGAWREPEPVPSMEEDPRAYLIDGAVVAPGPPVEVWWSPFDTPTPAQAWRQLQELRAEQAVGLPALMERAPR